MESELPEQASLNEQGQEQEQQQQQCAENGPRNSPTSSSVSRPSSSKARKLIWKRKPLEICKKYGGLSAKLGRNNSGGDAAAGAAKGRKTVSAAKKPQKLAEVNKPAETTEGIEDSSKVSPDSVHNSLLNDSEEPNPVKTKRDPDENAVPSSSKSGKKSRKLPEENNPNVPSEGTKETESKAGESNQSRPWRCGMRKPKRKVAEAQMLQQSPIRLKTCVDPERARKVQEYMELKQRERKKERQRMEAEAKAALQARKEKAKALELQRRDRLRMEAAHRSRKASFKRPAWDSDFSVFPSANIGPWTTAPEAEVGFPPPKPQATECLGSLSGGYEGLQFQEPRKGQFQQTQCQPHWIYASETCSDSQNQDLSSFPYPKGYVKKTPVLKPTINRERSDQPHAQKCKPHTRRVLATPMKSPRRASLSKSITGSQQRAHSRSSSSMGKYQRVSPRTLKRVVTASPFLRSSLEKKLEKQKQRASHKEVPQTNKVLRANDSQVSHKLGRVTSIRPVLKGRTQVPRASSVQPPKKSLQVKGKVYGKASVKRLGGVGSKKLQAISEEERLKARLMGFARKNTVQIEFPGFATQNSVQMPVNNRESSLLIPQNRFHKKTEPISRDSEICRSNEVKDERKLTDVESHRTSLLKTIAQQLAGHLNAAANIAKWKSNALYSPEGSNGACYDKYSDGPATLNNVEDNQFRSISVTELRQLLQKKCNPAMDLEMRDTQDGVAMWKGFNSATNSKKCIISSDEEPQKSDDTLSSSLQPTQQILTLNESSSCGITLHQIRSNKLPLPVEGEKLSVINLYLKHQHSKQSGETVLTKDLQLIGADGRLKRSSGAQDPWLHSSDNQTFAFPEIQGSCGLLLDSIQSPPNQPDKALLGKKSSELTSLSNRNNCVEGRNGRKLMGNDFLTEQPRMKLQRGKRMKKHKKSKRKEDILQMQKLPENLLTTKTKFQTISEDSGYHCSSDSSREGGIQRKSIKKGWLEKYVRRRSRESCGGQVKWNMNALEEELRRLDNEIVQTKARMERNPLFIHTRLPEDCVSSLAIQKHMPVIPKNDCKTIERSIEKENTIPSSPSSCGPKSVLPCSNATVKSSVSSEVLPSSATPVPQKDHSSNEAALENPRQIVPQVQLNSDSIVIASEGSTDVQSNSVSVQHDGIWNIRKCGLTGAKFNTLGAGLRYSPDDFDGAAEEENSHVSEVHEELNVVHEVASELNNVLPTHSPNQDDNLSTSKRNGVEFEILRKDLNDSSEDTNASVSENYSHIAGVNEDPKIVPNGGSEYDDVIPTHSPCQETDNYFTSEGRGAKFESPGAGLRDCSKDINGAVSDKSSHISVVGEDLKIVPEVTSEVDTVLQTCFPCQENSNFLPSDHSTDVCLTQVQVSHQTSKKEGSKSDKTSSGRWETDEDISEDIVCDGAEDMSEHSEQRNLPQVKQRFQSCLSGMLGGCAKKSEFNKLADESSLHVGVPLEDRTVNHDEANDFKHTTPDLQEARPEHSSELLCNAEEEHDIFILDAVGVGTVQSKETSLKDNIVSMDSLTEVNENGNKVEKSDQKRDSSNKESSQESSLKEYLSRHSRVDSEHHSIESWFEDSALDLSWAVCRPKEDIGSHVSDPQVEAGKESRCVTNVFGKDKCEKAVDFITDKLLQNILEDELSDFKSSVQSLPPHKLQLKLAVKGLTDSANSIFRSREESDCKDLPRKIGTNLRRSRQTSPSSKDSGSLENDSSSLATKFIFTSKSMRKYSSYITHHLSDRGTPVTDFRNDSSEGDISQEFVQSYVSKVLEVSGVMKDPSSLIWPDNDWAIPSDVYPVAGKSIPGVIDGYEINGGKETKLLFDAVNESLLRHSLKASALVLEFSRPLLTGKEAVQAVASDLFKNMNMSCKSGLDLEFLLEKSVDEDWHSHSRETMETCSQIAEALLVDLVGGLVNEFEDDCRISQLGVTGIEVF